MTEPYTEADGAVTFRDGGRDGDFIVKQDKRGKWRAYFRQVFTSANAGGWGRIDAGLHVRDYALRSEETGNPLPPLADRGEAIAQAARMIDAGELMPWGR